jgi:plasmid stability protein
VLDCISESLTMAILTVRNVPDEVHRALRLRAAEHGRSTEGEVREILALAVKPAQRMRMGEAMAAVAREAGVTDADVAALRAVLDDAARRKPAEPVSLK